MRRSLQFFTTAVAAALQLLAGRSVARSDDRRPPTQSVQLVVLPPPYSTSIFPVLSKHERKLYRNAAAHRQGCCTYCGVEFDFVGVDIQRAPTLDHVLPSCRGGANTLDNLVVCCMRCNSEKSGMTHGEFLAVLKRMRMHYEERVRRLELLEITPA